MKIERIDDTRYALIYGCTRCGNPQERVQGYGEELFTLNLERCCASCRGDNGGSRRRAPAPQAPQVQYRCRICGQQGSYTDYAGRWTPGSVVQACPACAGICPDC